MRKLFLASYFAEVSGLLPDFAGVDPAGKKVVFIPTAGLHEMSAQDREALDYINMTDRQALQNLGLIDFYLYVHYGSHYWGDDDECINKYFAKLNYKTLSDKQAVTVDGDRVEIVTAAAAK